jgi:hypothetical protein
MKNGTSFFAGQNSTWILKIEKSLISKKDYPNAI